MTDKKPLERLKKKINETKQSSIREGADIPYQGCKMGKHHSSYRPKRKRMLSLAWEQHCHNAKPGKAFQEGKC